MENFLYSLFRDCMEMKSQWWLNSVCKKSFIITYTGGIIASLPGHLNYLLKHGSITRYCRSVQIGSIQTEMIPFQNWYVIPSPLNHSHSTPWPCTVVWFDVSDPICYSQVSSMRELSSGMISRKNTRTQLQIASCFSLNITTRSLSTSGMMKVSLYVKTSPL